MKLEEFNLLSREERYTYWLDKSVAVANYHNSTVVKVLYQLDNFYIEATFLKSSPEESYLIAFTDENLIHKYLQKIDISSITNLIQ